MKLTPLQWVGVALVVLGVFAGSTSQLTTLFGEHATSAIVAASTILMSIGGGVVTFLGGSTGQINAVRAMPGVEKVVVNDKATGALAALAASPDDNKVEATPEAQKAVEATAKK